MVNRNIKHRYFKLDLSVCGVEGECDCVVHAVQSFSGKALLFHVFTDFGANISCIPIDKIYKQKPEKHLPIDFLQLWDCFSNEVDVIEYEFLKEKRAQIILKDKTKIWATYWMTVFWVDNGWTDEPTQFKEGHLMIGDNGQIFCQPNNRIYWKDMSFVNKPMKELKVIKERPSVEGFSDRWISDDSDSFYYDINEKS